MCPDWPLLMERAPDLQFKHYTVAEAHLPADALVNLPDGDAAICCDLEHNVFNAEHTESDVAHALAESHWYDLREWVTRGPGRAAAHG